MAGPEIFPSEHELDLFEEGVVVWALISPSPWWPAKVVNREMVEKELEAPAVDFPIATQSNRMVEFFNDNSCSVIETSEICEFTANIHLAEKHKHQSKIGKACFLAYKYLEEESSVDLQKSLFKKLPPLKVVRKGEEARAEYVKSPKKARGRKEQPFTKQKPNFSLKEWKDRGISSTVVRELDVPELGSALAAYLLQYRNNVSELFGPLRDCLNEYFMRERITGASLVGRHRIALDAFESCIGGALAENEKVGKCLGYEIQLRRFHMAVGWNSVQATNALSDWGALGVRSGVVESMDSNNLAKCLAAYMLGYDGKNETEFEELSEVIGNVLQKNYITGSTIVGHGRLLPDDFIAVLTNDPVTKEHVSKPGHSTSLRKFFYDLQ